MDPRFLENYLVRAVEELDINPLTPQLLRQIAVEEPALFAQRALKYFETDSGQRAQRILGALMLRYTPVLDRLVDPSEGSRQWALDVSRRLIRVDSSLDLKLGRRLPSRHVGNPGTTLSGAKALRCLEILDDTSPTRRLVPVIGHLIYDDDPAIAERTTLFVGRRIQTPEWAAKQLCRSSPRVRANALESLWGINTPAAVRLFESCVTDPVNRVAGNALVGLYLAGHTEILDRLAAMATGRDLLVRSTAIWVMRKLRDPSYLPILTSLARDNAQKVRSAAVRALIDIRRAQPSDSIPAAEVLAQPESAAESAPAESHAAPPRQQTETPPPDTIEFKLRLDGSSYSVSHP